MPEIIILYLSYILENMSWVIVTCGNDNLKGFGVKAIQQCSDTIHAYRTVSFKAFRLVLFYCSLQTFGEELRIKMLLKRGWRYIAYKGTTKIK